MKLKVLDLSKKRFLLINSFIFLMCFSFINAQIAERKRPAKWNNLVNGGRFMDRFLPMPDLGGTTSKTWGTATVIPRDINNGIEDNEWSYWGGNAKLIDGRYHLFVCRWAEDSPKGHMAWMGSEVVHATAKNSYGPYKVINTIEKGHNPELYITDDNKYIVSINGGYYVSENINGPWKFSKFTFNKRDRKIIEALSNLTYTKREDGSFIMICRGGGVWVSKDGLSAYNQLTDSSVYPPVDGRFEDPLIWKTEVQYHLIVNDWLGRIAWYLRSKDGVNWKVDSGEAYLPSVANHQDGSKEGWFKYERIKILQDKYGRATQAHFAVIDTLKHQDLSNDNHSSKHITIPLTVGKRISVLNKKRINSKTKEIIILINTEENFNPNTDLDFDSLKFGSPEIVDFGKGFTLKNFKKEGNNTILTFVGNDHGITQDNFAAKLLGKDKNGKLLFGYSRLPEVTYIEPILSARKPIFSTEENKLNVIVENFGQVVSNKASVTIFKIENDENIEIGNGIIPPLNPYTEKTIDVTLNKNAVIKNDTNYLVVINKDKKNSVSAKFE